MIAYKFSECAQSVKPDNDITRLLEKAMRKEPLNREEKDRVGNLLYGTFGSQAGTYKLAGWAWNLRSCLRRILVQFRWGVTFHPYYAPDKTALRKALTLPICEMIYA